jgi:hypothetical protein
MMIPIIGRNVTPKTMNMTPSRMKTAPRTKPPKRLPKLTVVLMIFPP